MDESPKPLPLEIQRSVNSLMRRRNRTGRKRKRGPGAKQKRLGHAIRKARQIANLTQAEFGQKLGVEGRTVHRWETNQSAPTQRHEREMVLTIKAYSVEAAAVLQQALDGSRGKAVPATAAPVAPLSMPSATTPSDAFSLAVFGLADDLDLPPRRLRRPLVGFFERLLAANCTLETAKQQLELWIAEQRY